MGMFLLSCSNYTRKLIFIYSIFKTRPPGYVPKCKPGTILNPLFISFKQIPDKVRYDNNSAALDDLEIFLAARGGSVALTQAGEPETNYGIGTCRSSRPKIPDMPHIWLVRARKE
jgi:hypothetical protein